MIVRVFSKKIFQLEQSSLRRCNPLLYNPVINALNSKPVLPSAAPTRNSTGLKIYTCTIVLTLAGDQKAFSQPSH